jgi:hypothetical protein
MGSSDAAAEQAEEEDAAEQAEEEDVAEQAEEEDVAEQAGDGRGGRAVDDTDGDLATVLAGTEQKDCLADVWKLGLMDTSFCMRSCIT